MQGQAKTWQTNSDNLNQIFLNHNKHQALFRGRLSGFYDMTFSIIHLSTKFLTILFVSGKVASLEFSLFRILERKQNQSYGFAKNLLLFLCFHSSQIFFENFFLTRRFVLIGKLFSLIFGLRQQQIIIKSSLQKSILTMVIFKPLTHIKSFNLIKNFFDNFSQEKTILAILEQIAQLFVLLFGFLLDICLFQLNQILYQNWIMLKTELIDKKIIRDSYLIIRNNKIISQFFKQQDMAEIQAFFEACEAGKGWQECQKYCLAGATFECDVLPFTTLEDYTNWMKGLVQGIMPDAKYQIISATHSADVYVYCAKFFGTHTLGGGPVPPSDPPKKTSCDYVYIIWYNNDNKVTKMRKIWDQLTAFKQLGWPLG